MGGSPGPICDLGPLPNFIKLGYYQTRYKLGEGDDYTRAHAVQDAHCSQGCFTYRFSLLRREGLGLLVWRCVVNGTVPNLVPDNTAS